MTKPYLTLILPFVPREVCWFRSILFSFCSPSRFYLIFTRPWKSYRLFLFPLDLFQHSPFLLNTGMPRMCNWFRFKLSDSDARRRFSVVVRFFISVNFYLFFPVRVFHFPIHIPSVSPSVPILPFQYSTALFFSASLSFPFFLST